MSRFKTTCFTHFRNDEKLLVFVTMTTPIFPRVKDKNDMFTARGEDMIFSKRRNPGIPTVSI